MRSYLNFPSHVNKGMKKVQVSEFQNKPLNKTHGPCPGLVSRIQNVTIQLVVLYGEVLWWRGQKNYQKDLQNLINQQARSIIEMYSSSPIALFISESVLLLSQILMDIRQYKYVHQILYFSDSIPRKDILSITLRIGD